VPSALRANNPLILKCFKQKPVGRGGPGNYKTAKKSARNLAGLYTLRNLYYIFVIIFSCYQQFCNFLDLPFPLVFSLKYFNISGLFILKADGTHYAFKEAITIINDKPTFA